MQTAHLVPELALARVITAGGPYAPGDEISLAFTTPSISRLVAHDPALRATCVPLADALVPEMISVVITHTAAPFSIGDVLTLSFVDPRIARVYLSTERQGTNVVPDLSTHEAAVDDASHSKSAERFSQVTPAEDSAATETLVHHADVEPIERPIIQVRPKHRLEETAAADSSFAGDAGETAPQLRAGECMTLQRDALARHETAPENLARTQSNGDTTLAGISPAGDRNPALEESESLPPLSPPQQQSSPQQSPAQQQSLPHVPGRAHITVRLEWNQERLRRFVQVVDKLFTIDRLGWYRHSLAMRLLIPDEIACGDTLAGIEAMRHLQALRAAAVESLGKPLLAACMPGFSITSQWLDSIESPREARAISGLREALLPYADDDERAGEPPTDAALFTTGTIVRRELLAENAVSVEAFLPLLIAPCSRDATLSASLAEYRRLLVELFTQTARAGEPVRLHQMAQANHSLDDRLWQVVGAAAEAFGGFALT